MPRRILYLLPTGYLGLFRQVGLISDHLPEDEFETRTLLLPGLQPGHEWSAEIDRLARRPWMTMALARRIQRFNPDMIHLWCPWIDSLVSQVQWAAAGRPLLITTQHGFKRSYPRWMRRHLIGKSRRIVTPSRALVHKLQAAGHADAAYSPWAIPRPSKTLPLPSPGLNGTNHVRNGAPAGVIGTTGRLTKDKRLKDLIWATCMLEQVNPIRFVIMGTGPESDYLRSYRDRVNTFDTTSFAGYQPEAHHRLSQFDVYWSSSTKPGPSISMLEALAAGISVIAIDTPSHREIIRDGINGFLIQPGQCVDFARITRQLLAEPQRRSELGQAAREAISAHAGEDQALQTLTQHYRDLI